MLVGLEGAINKGNVLLALAEVALSHISCLASRVLEIHHVVQAEIDRVGVALVAVSALHLQGKELRRGWQADGYLEVPGLSGGKQKTGEVL